MKGLVKGLDLDQQRSEKLTFLFAAYVIPPARELWRHSFEENFKSHPTYHPLKVHVSETGITTK